MAIGFGAASIGVISRASTRWLILFVFNIAIPIMLFYRIATIQFPREIAWSFLLGYYASVLVAYVLGMCFARFLFQRSLAEQSIYGLGAGFSNTVLLGIPLLVSAFGQEAMVPVFLIIAFHSATLLPVSIFLIQMGRRSDGSWPEASIAKIMIEVLANPIIGGIVLGLASNLTGFTLPGPVDTAGNLMATVAIPSALVALGASLAGYKLEGQIGPASVLAGIKLLVQPVVAWILLVKILGLGAPWAPVAVVMAGMPSGAMVYLFGARYGAAPEVAASVVVISSAASVVTLSVLLALMGA